MNDKTRGSTKTSFWRRFFQRKSAGGRAVVDPEICNGCARCLAVCPTKAIVLKTGYAEINRDKCMNCGICLVTCPQKAIYFPRGSE
ncbi:MAG TPA: 4Fe-4S binding protein [Synergistales bacterium]|nr:4Fe-4S binding protein [Synergistales bacterium]